MKAPTGTGKTVMFAAMLKWPELAAWLDAAGPRRGARMLVVAHREELLDQAAAKIQAANPGLMVSIEQGDRHANRYSDVVIASIQTLSARKFTRLKALLAHHTFRLVIVDEAHHAAAATYRTALVHLGFLPPADATDEETLEAPSFDDVAVMASALAGWDDRAPKDRLLVGVTATPNRTDAIGLGCVFQTIASSYGLKQAIDDTWLVPIKPWVIETSDSLDAVRTTAGDFNQKDLASTVNNPKRNALAVSSWQVYAEGRPTLAFTVDVAHAHDLAEAFTRQGVRARALSGETPKDDRRAILASYTAGDLDVITNCMVLTEGTDLPRTSCILHAKPTKSATLYEQMTGRGLRLFPGKDECIVLDLVDVARRHSLQAAPVLYGLPPGLNGKGATLGQLEADLAGLQEKYPGLDLETLGRFSIQDLLDRASTFDVWTIPTLAEHVAAVVSMNWILAGPETYRIQYPWNEGVETLLVAKDMLGHFDVSLTFRTPPPSAGGTWGVRQRTIATGVTSSLEALKLAESFVQQERRGVNRLKDRGAPWRQGAPSEKQLALLKRLRVPFNPATITKGGASDLIDVANAKRGRR